MPLTLSRLSLYEGTSVDYLPMFVMLTIFSRFAARVQRFIDAYASGSSGSQAIKWATKEFRSHRQTPSHIPYDQIAPGYVHRQ